MLTTTLDRQPQTPPADEEAPLTAQDSRRRRQWEVWGVLALIMLVAGVLRAWGLDFGLPNLSRPDEQNISQFALRHMLEGTLQGRWDLNPDFFQYPSLHLYLTMGLYALYYAWGLAVGQWQIPQEFIGLYLNDYTSFHLLTRWMTVAFGVLTMPAVYALARTLGGTRRLGLLSAGLMAVTYLHVRDSHFGVTDVPATLWVTLSLWQAAVFARLGRKNALYWAALLAGLAASTKYPVALVLLAAWVPLWLGTRPAVFPTLSDRVIQTVMTLGLALGAFLLTSPYVVLDFQQFWSDFSYQQQHAEVGHLLDLGLGWDYHLRFSLWYGLGAVYCLTALAGIFCIGRRRLRLFAGALVFGVAYYALVGASYTVFVRYVIPLLPVLAVCAALAIDTVARRPIAQGAFAAPWTRWVLYAALWLAVAGGSILPSLQYDALLAHPDTRTLARNWLLERLQPGESVGIGIMLSHLELPAHFRKLALNPFEDPIAYTMRQGHRYFESPQIVFKPEPSPRNEFGLTSYRLPKSFQDLGARYFAVARHSLTLYMPPEFEIAAIAQNYRLAARFSPVADGRPMPAADTFDQIDAFYVPYTRLDAIERPGPEILIYEVPPRSVEKAPGE